MTTKEPLTLRTTSTGVKVIEGDCPHCGHLAIDHWESGCKASPRSDHCRMDPWKLERIAQHVSGEPEPALDAPARSLMTDPGRKARPKSAVVKALTVQQPWAWAIIHGGKSVENRTQAWSYRGPLAIHAGVRVSQRGLDSPLMRLPGTVELRSEVVDRELRMLWLVNDPDHALVLRKFGVRTPLGAIIGVVQLVDVHTAERGCCESPWAEAAYAEHSGRTRRDVVHLVLEHPRELAVPIPCRGALGLWTPPVDVVEQLGGAIAS